METIIIARYLLKLKTVMVLGPVPITKETEKCYYSGQAAYRKADLGVVRESYPEVQGFKSSPTGPFFEVILKSNDPAEAKKILADHLRKMADSLESFETLSF